MEGNKTGKAAKAIKDNLKKAIKAALKKLIQKKIIITVCLGALLIVAGFAAFNGIGSALRTIWDGTVKFFSNLGTMLQKFWNWLWTGETYSQDSLWLKLEQKYDKERKPCRR